MKASQPKSNRNQARKPAEAIGIKPKSNRKLSKILAHKKCENQEIFRDSKEFQESTRAAPSRAQARGSMAVSALHDEARAGLAAVPRARIS